MVYVHSKTCRWIRLSTSSTPTVQNTQDPGKLIRRDTKTDGILGIFERTVAIIFEFDITSKSIEKEGIKA